MRNNYLRENIEVFSKAFTEMELAYNTGDVDSFMHILTSIKLRKQQRA